VQIGVVASVFVLVALAELPDKTMIATLVMGSRYRPSLVWLGASAAFLVHTVLAVAAGQLLHLLPQRALHAITTVLFGAASAYLLFVPERREEERGVDEAVESRRWTRTAGAAFAVIFVGEFGDLTQILIANLAARDHAPAEVFVGAFAALTSVAAVGAFTGAALLRVVPFATVRKVGGVVLAVLTVASLVTLIRG
jgi:putative Ca2+/H+ antiporter (TMEM165/GDT1 family)